MGDVGTVDTYDMKTEREREGVVEGEMDVIWEEGGEL